MRLPLESSPVFQYTHQSVNWKVGNHSVWSHCSFESKEDVMKFWKHNGLLLLPCLITGIQRILEGPRDLVHGYFCGLDLLVLRTVPSCSWQLCLGNISCPSSKTLFPWDLAGTYVYFYLFIFGCTGSSLQYAGSVVMTHRLSRPMACRILVSWPEIKPISPRLKGRFLTKGTPGKSPCMFKLTQILISKNVFRN